MKNIIKCLLMIALLAGCMAYSQSKPVKDQLLDHMTGKWVLKGTIGGQETTHDISAEWVLGQQYIELKEVSREKDPSGKPLYEAIVYITWIEASKQYSCLWLDNSGNTGLSGQAVGIAKPDGDNIRFVFRISDNDTFHTTFSYDKSSDTWKWFMDNQANAKMEPFARVLLSRVTEK